METAQGGCHCGAIRFRVALRSHDGIDCNCSICLKKGFVHLLVEEQDFELIEHVDGSLQTYTFGTHTAKHHFCATCGIHSFYRPRSHPHMVDVNVRCLDDVDLDKFNIKPFDGRDWDGNIDQIR